MPNVPLRELIMRDVVATLEGIVQGASYWTHVGPGRVFRDVPGNLAVTKPLVVVVEQGIGDVLLPKEGGGSGSGVTETRMRVDVYGFYSRESGDDTASQKFMADIERAMTQGRYRGTNPDGGRNATNTRIVSREKITPEEGNVFSVRVGFEIWYRHAYAEPGVRI